jgi:hypothetical protein
MRPFACVVLLLAAATFASAAGRVDVTAALNLKGGAKVTVDAVSDAELAEALPAAAATLQDQLLVKLLIAPPEALQKALAAHAFSNIVIRQKLVEGSRETHVEAEASSVDALAFCGGRLALKDDTKGGYLLLKGAVGGALKGAAGDLSALRDVQVTLRVSFPGTVVKCVPQSACTRSGQAVSYAWTADRLLLEPTTIDAQVRPDIEGAPGFWLALTLGVTALVVVGAAIILQRRAPAVDEDKTAAA